MSFRTQPSLFDSPIQQNDNYDNKLNAKNCDNWLTRKLRPRFQCAVLETERKTEKCQ